MTVRSVETDESHLVSIASDASSTGILMEKFQFSARATTLPTISGVP